MDRLLGDSRASQESYIALKGLKPQAQDTSLHNLDPGIPAAASKTSVRCGGPADGQHKQLLRQAREYPQIVLQMNNSHAQWLRWGSWVREAIWMSPCAFEGHMIQNDVDWLHGLDMDSVRSFPMY